MNDQPTAAIRCNLCEGREVSVLSDVGRSGAPLRTVACRRCGLVWSDPRPHDARRFYESDYRLAYKGTFEPRPKHVLRAGKVALARLATIETLLGTRMRVLDVGSGGGEFAHLLQTLGHDVHGVEPNLGYARYAATQYGLRITRAFVDEVTLPERGYDLITIWHVLEHTEDPGAVLARLERALAPGGTLVVEVPNVEATCQSPRSTFHEAHLYGFNRATLEGLAAKAGLRMHACRIAADGGNITVFLGSRPEPAPEAARALPGNHDRIARIVHAHTPLAHWLSGRPLARLARRVARMSAEWWQTRRSASGRERLDALYARALRPRTPGMRPWHAIAAAYVAAVALEWVLLDLGLPWNGWHPDAGLGAYLATQCAIVLGVVWTTQRPRTVPQFVKLAGWATPLFTLPAYC